MSGTRENTYTFLVSSADPDDTPVWVDLTDWVVEDEEPMVALTGRQNDLDEADAGRFQAQLANDDDAFTYGSSVSPYAAWWGPGRKCQLRETIAGQTFDLWTGYLETPTEQLVTATEDGTGDRKRVSITAVDRMGRLESAEPFESALSSYIIDTHDLVGYWPLTEDSSTTFNSRGPSVGSVRVAPVRAIIANGAMAQILPAAGQAPPGSEASGLRLLTASSAGSAASYYGISTSGTVPAGWDIGTGETLTVVFWGAITGVTAAASWIAQLTVLGSVGDITLVLSRNTSTGVWSLTATSSMTGTITIGVPADAALFPIGIRLEIYSANMELWVGGQRYTVALGGSAPTDPTLAGIDLAFLPIDLDASHLQVYVGSNYTFSDFAAQIAMGYTPLERQTTGERIRTIARYAGIPESELLIDTGQAVMQAASLAGKTPLAAMREAEAVERGLLHVDGSGRLVFKDRRTLYNV